MTKGMDEFIERYGAADAAEATAIAQQQVFDMITQLHDGGIQLDMMVQILDLWMEWSFRLIAGTLMNIASDLNQWDADEQERYTKDMMDAFHLLKQDSHRAVLEMALLTQQVREENESE